MLNTISLRGILMDVMTTTASVGGGKTYHGTVAVQRLSGTVDYLPIVIEGAKFPNLDPFFLTGNRVTISGEIRRSPAQSLRLCAEHLQGPGRRAGRSASRVGRRAVQGSGLPSDAQRSRNLRADGGVQRWRKGKLHPGHRVGIFRAEDGGRPGWRSGGNHCYGH